MDYEQVFNKPYPSKTIIKKLTLGGLILGVSLTLLTLLVILFMVFVINPLYTWFLLLVLVLGVFSIAMIIHNFLLGIYLNKRNFFISTSNDYLKLFIPLFMIDFLFTLYFLHNNNFSYSTVIYSLVCAFVLTLQAFILSSKVLPKS